MTENYQAKINPRNKVFAEKIRAYAKKYSIIGVVDVEGLPAPQFQRIRANLKKTAEVLIVKKNLIELVLSELESSHKGISELVAKAGGVVGLIFTNDNPFTMYKAVKKSKSSAPAKAGATAPKNIIVPAGPTSFSPGPIIGELGALKIKAGINGGKVEIKEDSEVAKEGDVISEALAGVLTRLGIEPMEVGLNIKAVYESGTLYTRETLDVDEDAILADLKAEAARASALAYGLGYITKDNVERFVSESARDALTLGIELAYPAAETIKQLASKANAQASGLASTLPEEVRPAGLAQVAPATSAPVAEDNNSSSANEGSKEEDTKEVDASAGLGGLF